NQSISVVKRKTERGRSVGGIGYRCARQSIVVDGVSIEPVAVLFCYDQQLAVVTKANLGGIGPRAANQRARGARQWCECSILVEVKACNIGSATLVEHVQQIVVCAQAVA